jgi:hypothetical protein
MELVEATCRSLVGSCKVDSLTACATTDDSSADRKKTKKKSFLKSYLFRVKPVFTKVSNLQLESIDLQ